MNHKSESQIFDLSKIERSPAIANMVFFSTIESTNDWAKQFCRRIQGTPFDAKQWPLLVLADLQTAGRGQGSKCWISDEGSLTFTYVFDTKRFELEGRLKTLFPLVSGLAVAKTIDEMTGQTSLIKWPNDVILADKKVAGILTETVSGSTEFVAIGIGVNISTAVLHEALPFAGSLDRALLSMNNAANARIDPSEFLICLLTHLEAGLRMLRNANNSWVAEINQKSWLSGKQIHVRSGEQDICGTVSHIDSNGGLVIETNGSQNSLECNVKTIYSGQVVQTDHRPMP